jgi:DNA-binding response OmpR family regulator
MRILYIEDERGLSTAVSQVLSSQHFVVDQCYDGESGLYEALTGIYDLIILDLMLPKRDGLSVLKEIRQNGMSVPVILLTAKGGIKDRVTGLDSGADDYLAKPFHMDELLARIRVLARRNGLITADNTLRFGDIELDLQSLLLFCGENSFRLTAKESQLLELLLVNQGILLTFDTIINRVWGFSNDADDNNLRVLITILRRKLKALKSAVQIQNVRGVGYTLEYRHQGTLT